MIGRIERSDEDVVSPAKGQSRKGRQGVRRGQALMELAVGMFALALLVSALSTFTLYIVRSLEIENHLRGGSKGVADKIELGDFESKNVFGTKDDPTRTLHIKEPFGNTDRTIP